MKLLQSLVRKKSLVRCSACIGAGALLATPIGTTSARDSIPDPIARIEEDWELDVNEPASESCSPQFHTVMSPYASLNGLYFQVTWNYHELPEVVEGGLQLQVWGGDSDFATRDAGDGYLSNDAERVTWTAALSTDNSHVTFAIENGFSQSWGSFGGESMRVRTPRPLADLHSYNVDLTTASSWITYGSNRVNRLVLKEVRKYAEDGTLLSQDTQERVIYQTSEDDTN
jgi:hypothetical protein